MPKVSEEYLESKRNMIVDAAYQVWQSALVQEDVMKKSFERTSRLFDQNVVSAQKFDEVKAKYDAAVTQSAAAKSQYDMALAGARKEDKDAAAALVAQADGAVQEVEGYMAELYLIAPADGVVSAIYPHRGELVGTGAPVMTITDLEDMWFTFNVREDYLHSMERGDELTLEIPALDGRSCKAKVTYMAVRDSYATWKATKEIGQNGMRKEDMRCHHARGWNMEKEPSLYSRHTDSVGVLLHILPYFPEGRPAV